MKVYIISGRNCENRLASTRKKATKIAKELENDVGCAGYMDNRTFITKKEVE